MASTVILGSGIIGLSTAYYLAEHQPGSSIHLVDASPELFASASGYAAGFLAKDWFQPSVAALGALSFEEHRRLAEREGGGEKWGYAKSVAVRYDLRARKTGKEGRSGKKKRAGAVDRKERESANMPAWLRRGEDEGVEVVDAVGNTAIVDPLQLCHFLLAKCKAAGVQIHHPATALSIGTDVRGELARVCIGYTDSSSETELPATRLLLAAGAWTPAVFASLFPTSALRIPVTSLAGHSLVVRHDPPRDGRACSAVFCRPADDDGFAPELYQRPSGVVYLAGLNALDTPLPARATGATPVPAAVDEMRRMMRRLVVGPEDGDGAGDGLEVVRVGLCFRPVTPGGRPIVARLADEQLGPGVATRPGQEGGVFVATGHGPWGITLALGTGRVVADMMQGREASADVSGLGMSFV